MASGRTFPAMSGMFISSTSRAARCASRPTIKAVVTPVCMLSPPRFPATRPTALNAAATILVVVDFPLVPVMRTHRLPALNSSIISGLTRSATRPPNIPPAPRPIAFEAARAPRPATRAARARAERDSPRDCLGVIRSPQTNLRRSAICPRRRLAISCQPVNPRSARALPGRMDNSTGACRPGFELTSSTSSRAAPTGRDPGS